MASRRLFVEPLLEPPESAVEPPAVVRYDEARSITVTGDGTPCVMIGAPPPRGATYSAQAAEGRGGGWAGTITLTHVDSEQEDADAPAAWAGTTTMTAVHAEQEDVDAPMAWGDTQLDTRAMPADVRHD